MYPQSDRCGTRCKGSQLTYWNNEEYLEAAGVGRGVGCGEGTYTYFSACLDVQVGTFFLRWSRRFVEAPETRLVAGAIDKPFGLSICHVFHMSQADYSLKNWDGKVSRSA